MVVPIDRRAVSLFWLCRASSEALRSGARQDQMLSDCAHRTTTLQHCCAIVTLVAAPRLPDLLH